MPAWILTHLIQFWVEPTIFEPRLNFKPRLKFFKFDLWSHLFFNSFFISENVAWGFSLKVSEDFYETFSQHLGICGILKVNQ